MSTQQVGPSGFDARFKTKLGPHHQIAVARFLAAGVHHGDVAIPDALRSVAGRYVPSSFSDKTWLATAPLLDLVAKRWASVPLGSLTVATLNDWFVQLAYPESGKAMPRSELLRLLGFFWMALTTDAFEAAAGERMQQASMHLFPAWSEGNPAAIGGVGTAGGLGYAIGEAVAPLLGRRGGKSSGGKSSIAATLPKLASSGVWLTEPRAFLVAEDVDLPGAAWHVERSKLAGVRLNAHIRLMHRFEIDFADGSKAGFFCVSKHPGIALRKTLGSSK